MPKYILRLLVIGCWLLVLTSYFLILNSPLVFAQSPTPTGAPTCDLCGWCNSSFYPKPPDWEKCHNCLYDPSGREATGSAYTVFGCIATSPEAFVKSILSIVFGVSGGIAFLAVLSGSAIVLTSAGNPERLQTGKDIIFSSIVGILLILFSVFLLRFVGFEILRIPGFG